MKLSKWSLAEKSIPASTGVNLSHSGFLPVQPFVQLASLSLFLGKKKICLFLISHLVLPIARWNRIGELCCPFYCLWKLINLFHDLNDSHCWRPVYYEE